MFAAGELTWQHTDLGLRVGAWVNSADHARLNGSTGTEQNYGLYGTLDGNMGQGRWNLRLGWANEEVSSTSGFAALALEYPVAGNTLGFGLAHSEASSDLGPTASDMQQAELYTRFEFNQQFHLTPSLQYIRNSGFDGSGTVYDPEVTVLSLRPAYTF